MDDSTAAFLREFLKTTDVPCPACDYNLRGLTAARCPECGEAIEIRVGSVVVAQTFSLQSAEDV